MGKGEKQDKKSTKASETKSGKKGKKGEKKTKRKDSQLIIRINREERDEFVALCEELDTSAAREIRKFMRRFVAANYEEE